MSRISITFRKMDESLHPVGFIPEPDLQNIQPLPDNAIEYSQGSVSNGQAEAESKSIKKGKKHRGRSSGFQYQPDTPEITPVARPRQVIDARSATSSDNSTGRGRDSSGRSFDSRPKSSPHDSRRLIHDGDEPFRRSPQQEWADEGNGYSEAGMEANGRGRRVRADQKRIVISRNMDGDTESSSRGYDHGILGPYRTPNAGRRRVRVVLGDDK